jgi:hypothetical protein
MTYRGAGIVGRAVTDDPGAEENYGAGEDDPRPGVERNFS